MNNELRQKETNDFEKDVFKLMNNPVFGITIENVRRCKGINLVKTKRKRSYLVSQQNFHTTNFFFSKNLRPVEMKMIQVIKSKPVYFGFSILVISNTKKYGMII